MIQYKNEARTLKTNNLTYTYLETLVPFFYGGLIVRCMGFEEIHVLFGKFIFADETTHDDPCKDIFLA